MRENNTHQLSRNEILRIMGLSGRVSGIANSVESIRAALRDENGKLARYYTSITQNADEIKLLAARETESEEAVAELTIKYNNIESTVQTNKQQTDAALSTLSTNLQNEVNARIAANSAQDDVFATYKSQTDRSISSIAAHWDANDHLIGYSTTTQTAAMISSAVTAINNDLTTNYSTKTQTANAISSAVTEVNENIQKLEESWEQGAYAQTANKTLTELKTNNNYAIRYSVLIPVTSSTAFYINDGYEVNVVYFNASKQSLGSRSSVEHDGDVGKPLSITPPANAVYGAIYIASSSALAPSGFKNTGFLVVNKEIVTQAYLSLYVDKQSVSWLTGSADNVIFNFNNRFQIQHLGTAVLEVKANGDLEITGTLKPNSNIGTINPIQVDSSGNINRKAPDGSVIPLYAGRYVRYLNYDSLAGRTYTMSADDDYVICNGNYSDKKIYLPYSPSQGKVVSIKNVGGVTLLYTSNSNHTIRKTDTPETQPVDLNGYDRAELVYHSGAWRWNVMSI